MQINHAVSEHNIEFSSQNRLRIIFFIIDLIFLSIIIFSLNFDIKIHSNKKESEKREIELMKIIHDIKNPITSIISISKDTDISLSEIQGSVQDDAVEIQEMLENLRMNFKLQQGMDVQEQPTPTSTVELMKSFVRAHAALSNQTRNSLTVEVQPEFPELVTLPRITIKRIVNNFITNSLKHTHRANVRVKIMLTEYEELVSTPHGTIHVCSLPNPSVNQFTIEVSDEGLGIPPSLMKEVFKEKASDQSDSNWDGTGLGLPICQMLAEKVGAFIRYSSIPGKRTQFSLHYPLQGSGVIESFTLECKIPRMSTDTSDQTHQCHAIYIAEDNPSVTRQQERICRKLNLPLVSFIDGQECFDQFSKSDYTCCKQILVITDFQMPRMDGVTLGEHLRTILPRGVLKLVLASADNIEDEQAPLNIFDKFFVKPIKVSEIKELQNTQVMNDNSMENSVQNQVQLNSENSYLKNSNDSGDINKIQIQKINDYKTKIKRHDSVKFINIDDKKKKFKIVKHNSTGNQI